MRKQRNKVKQFSECEFVYLHRRVRRIKHDTVFVIVNIGRILETPRTVIYGDRYDPVVLACRGIDSSGIALILAAEIALGIAALWSRLCRRNGAGVLFRFGQIDGNINLTVWTVYLPLLILLYAISADIIAILTQFIK